LNQNSAFSTSSGKIFFALALKIVFRQHRPEAETAMSNGYAFSHFSSACLNSKRSIRPSPRVLITSEPASDIGGFPCDQQFAEEVALA
jgi:hypothetical protein